ncbi:MAG: hypothetical protein RIT00_231 [Actinomycetota bacterium]
MTMQNDEKNNDKKNSDNLELIDKLKGISEQLADKALDALKQAHAAGESKLMRQASRSDQKLNAH